MKSVLISLLFTFISTSKAYSSSECIIEQLHKIPKKGYTTNSTVKSISEVFIGTSSLKECINKIQQAPCLRDGIPENISLYRKQGWNSVKMTYAVDGLFNDIVFEETCKYLEPGSPTESYNFPLIFDWALQNIEEIEILIMDGSTFQSYLENHKEQLVGRVRKSQVLNGNREAFKYYLGGPGESNLSEYYFNNDSNFVRCQQSENKEFLMAFVHKVLDHNLSLSSVVNVVCEVIHF
ncbi:MAG: hypothetical protein KDD58_16110 [Bdellovibrionales bacterium]|nr:hypothetical protein [Bdellovibrionales bacterium]